MTCLVTWDLCQSELNSIETKTVQLDIQTL